MLIDNIPCAVATITPQYIVQDINNELARLTGVKREEACGKKCYDVFGFGEICPGCPVRGAQLTGTVCRNVKRGINRKDREIWIEQTAIPLLDSDDTVRQVVEIIYDITAKVQLEEQKNRLFIETVTALAELIDKRDSATGKHSLRVRDLAVALGREMGLAARELDELATAAILHDIGKIGIPENILNKPGRLTAEEYEIIKRHPVIGYNTLKNIHLLQNIAQHILHHHERYDGKGYPAGLQGEQIPLASRIICIADVYEALTADRVYRPRMDLKQALRVMWQEKGRMFDPVALDIFFRMLAQEDPRVGEALPEIVGQAAAGLTEDKQQ
ncbi:PAS domain S-box-containing protein/HDIG domain-containing protein [Sporolituus thermophilus DSM 23256]|uniref:PAS domain S-box-containing protein/HDIG domain-containing protein n=1 Tax=Sporolituus thermophilus DSM 23256 TaxID=1123285 RepID=A0A1G7PC86_9FIRM|nr:PAS domain S-box-containing protein/HDIG domain-containing protein [Sporolituus thermophilus DSM 23256]